VNNKDAELIYISVADNALTPADIKLILETSKINNAKQNITGLLCFDGQRFLQIFEGPKDTIKDLYQTVAQDSRHKDIELIHFDDIETRTFHSWQMAFKGAPERLLTILTDRSAVLNFPEAFGALNTSNSSFGSSLFSIIMSSTYDTEPDTLFMDDTELHQLSFRA